MIELNVSPNGEVTIPGEPDRYINIKVRVGDAIRLKASDGSSVVVTACGTNRGACAKCVFFWGSSNRHARKVTDHRCPRPIEGSPYVLCGAIEDFPLGLGYFTTVEDLI